VLVDRSGAQRGRYIANKFFAKLLLIVALEAPGGQKLSCAASRSLAGRRRRHGANFAAVIAFSTTEMMEVSRPSGIDRTNFFGLLGAFWSLVVPFDFEEMSDEVCDCECDGWNAVPVRAIKRKSRLENGVLYVHAILGLSRTTDRALVENC